MEIAMTHPLRLLVVLAVSAALGCTAALREGRVRSGTTYRQKLDLRFNGFRRSYRVHVPGKYDPNLPTPLVVVLHGAFMTAAGMETQTGFSELADREGFIVLYPNGIGIFGLLQHWNAGHCCGKAAADAVDDVGFVARCIEDAGGMLNVDRHRIYMTGFSNGAMLAHRFGAERPRELAAIAPLAGSIGGGSDPETGRWVIPRPDAPLPVILFHGRRDDKVPYDGGFVGGKTDGRRYDSVGDAVAFWTDVNGCSSGPVVHTLRRQQVTVETWDSCTDNARVELYSLQDWGHRWPGPFFTDRLDPSDPLYGFDAAEIIWRFFSSCRR
jgi:polyhydroxybutyrate depolymerase